MKKEDAELKANALAKDLIEKEAENKGSKTKCIIIAVRAVSKPGYKEDFDVYCFFSPADHKPKAKEFREEIDHFLSNYRIINKMPLVS